MARKGRARRFREARELKQGFDDQLFGDGDRTLADVLDTDDDDDDGDAGWDDEEQATSAWGDEDDDPLYDPRDEPRG